MEHSTLLDHSFKTMLDSGLFDPEDHQRLVYLATYVFGFTTYDEEASALFARKAVEVCQAITEGTTFEYVKGKTNSTWYLLMCNMPFFAKRLDWGSSIRGAWWDASRHKDMLLKSTGLWQGDEQLLELSFTLHEWKGFMAAVVAFAEPDMATPLEEGAAAL